MDYEKRERDFWRDAYADRGTEFVEGLKAGLDHYAHFINGTYYIGVTGKLLSAALQEIDDAFELWKLEV